MMNIRHSTLLALISSALPLCAASVIVNEINAKSSGATPSGDWFELVVVGDGTAGSSVDMRGWRIRIDNNGATQTGYLKLSDHAYWSAVVAGTILTFTEDNAGPSGAATSILGTNQLATLGWAHTNIWAGDATYMDTTWELHDASFPIDHNNSQILIENAAGEPVFGPAGEGHVGYPGGGVNSSEVFKLEADPSPLITLTSPYNDGGTDTFGRPNEWSGGASRQSFAAFVIPEPSTLLPALLSLMLLAVRRPAV